CGIDIATQQLRPAMTSTVWRAAGDIPNGSGDGNADPWVATVDSVSGDRRRRDSVSGNMVATQKIAMPRYVARQPAVWMNDCTSGGQTVPARKLPLAMIATAMPRRLANHSDVSAMSGANATELPTPTRSPWAAMNCQRLVAWLARAYPSPSDRAPPTA